MRAFLVYIVKIRRWWRQNVFLARASYGYRWFRRHWFKIGCSLFILYHIFWSDYSLVQIMSLRNKEASLGKEVQRYQDSIDHFDRQIEELNVNPEKLERYARERMYMHRENEDIYLLK